MMSTEDAMTTKQRSTFDISKILNVKAQAEAQGNTTEFKSDKRVHESVLASPPSEEGMWNKPDVSYKEHADLEKQDTMNHHSSANYPTPPPGPRLPNLPTLASFFREEQSPTVQLPSSSRNMLPPVQMGHSPSSPLKTPISAPQLSSTRHPTPIPRDDRRDLRYIPYASPNYYEELAYHNPNRMTMSARPTMMSHIPSPNAYPANFEYRSPHSPPFGQYGAHPGLPHMPYAPYPGEMHPSLAGLDGHYYGVQQMKQQTRSKRQRPTPVQLRILKSVFNETFFPSSATRQALSMLLGMPPRAVQVWFQNRRQQWRLTHGSAEYEAGVRKMKVESGDVDLEKILINLKLKEREELAGHAMPEYEDAHSVNSSPLLNNYSTMEEVQ